MTLSLGVPTFVLRALVHKTHLSGAYLLVLTKLKTFI